MNSFDLSAEWVILAPVPAPAAVEELARCIAALRERDGLGKKEPAILDAAGPAPEDSAPIIVLNMDNSSNERGGYTWRMGRGRLEIYGDSRRGLCNGIYSFLAALGFRWPQAGEELLPASPGTAGTAKAGEPGRGIYPLSNPGTYVPSNPSPEQRRRLAIPPETHQGEIPALCRWAARNRVDVVIFSFKNQKNKDGPVKWADHWDLVIEWGGWDLGLLVPRRHFFLKRDLFRLEGGKRRGDHHFCPTHPETITLIQLHTAALLEQHAAWYRARQRAPAPEARHIYHLWPDRGAESLWCACPACRAFSPREQIRLALNTAAAVIAKRDPQALIGCREEGNPAEQLPGGSEITLRPNVFALKTERTPDERPEESPMLFMYEKGLVREW
ncbi:MAG: hypothetical protein LBL56_07695 [Treponema sp.]|jgi:hypothetical protein|nr:hypothetical protein [Treponema sp.]